MEGKKRSERGKSGSGRGERGKGTKRWIKKERQVREEREK